jgi:predicted RNase H-like HicB family nuclease
MRSMVKPEPTHYTYRVAWSVEDDEHVATVAEFASLSWLAPTPQEAISGLINLVRDVVEDMVADGEAVPEPSLNRLVSERLARA